MLTRSVFSWTISQLGLMFQIPSGLKKMTLSHNVTFEATWLQSCQYAKKIIATVRCPLPTEAEKAWQEGRLMLRYH
jgi:hypothetical protein